MVPYSLRLSFGIICLLGLFASPITAAMSLEPKEIKIQTQPLGATQEAVKPDAFVSSTGDYHTESQVNLPPGWLAIPFVVLLLMIATGPLLYEKFWHQHYSKVTLLLITLVMVYYLGISRDFLSPIESFMEYVQFIALISALYMASGGILIEVNQQATPWTNLVVLLLGAVMANFIGTTGASMLLIRPYLRLNHGRIKVYHVVFFIFIVSNVGGVLTPIGDPPLFLGFLNGVPFFWSLQHNLLPWLVVLSLLGTIFYFLDIRNDNDANKTSTPKDRNKLVIRLVGKRNLIWLAVIIGAVFIDPNIFDWVPALHYDHHVFSFMREIILLSVAGLSYYYAEPYALQKNEFSVAPLKEIAMIFVGIFGTMMPALQLIRAFAASEAGQAIITHNTLYWSTGIFSSVLDNAPTYLNFVAASMAAHGANITELADVQAFAKGDVFTNSVLQLKAISIASVFFGAMTYIGNGPNFMVKAIAEHKGLRMPSFFMYIFRFSIPILLPVLVVVWLLFFAFA